MSLKRKTDLENVRLQLISLGSRRRTRTSVFTRQRPTDWRPSQVLDPHGDGQCFTDDGAWRYICDQLEEGHEFREVILNKPPGKSAYVMIFVLADDQPPLYVKLELGSGKVLGRSFHYSEERKFWH